MLHLEPKDISVPEVHRLILGGVAPRPIALAATISSDGINNLSPFSFFNAFGANPPIVAFSPSRRGTDATFKDTYNNLMATKECVINAVTYSIVEQVSLASAEFSPNVDEFIKSGLTPVDSDIVKPKRVKESPFQMECKLLEMKSFGQGNVSSNLAICEVLKFHVDESIFTDGIIDPLKIDLVARMSANYYSRASSGVFIVEKPIGKKCIGVDQLPKHIRESDTYTGNDLAKFGNSESIPDESEVHKFIQGVMNEIKSQTEVTYNDFLEFLKLNDYKKMLKAALQVGENKKKNLELTAKIALKNNDVDFAWKTAMFAKSF